MHAAWLVRSRQMETRFKFYLAILGYDRRDRSLSHKIYLGYAALFFSIWGFAVMSLLASSGAVLLVQLNPLQPAGAAARLAFLALIVWTLVSLYQVIHRSPLVFSEDDAYLICQTPINRQKVVLAWFPADWLETALVFAAGAVVLGFSLSELSLSARPGITDIPAYAASGLRAMVPIVLAQMGIHALLWAVGCLRLRGERNPRWLRPAALALILLGGGSLAWSLIQGGMMAGFPATVNAVYGALLLTLRASFGQVALLPGLGAALITTLAGLAVLWLCADRVNLSRAAQETHDLQAVQAASQVGAVDLAQELLDRRRLGTSHTPARLPAYPGPRAMLWKDMLQSLRLLQPMDFINWAVVAGSALGAALLPTWQGRSLALLFWVIAASQRGNTRLHRDLAQWGILRQLPFSTSRLLLAELAPAWLLILVISGLCLLPLIGQPGLFWAAVVLLPSVSAGVILLGAHDIIHQANTAALLVGYAPEVSARGAGLGLLITAVPIGLVYWLNTHTLPPAASLLLAAGTSAAVTLAVWRITTRAFTAIE
jgi:hypothetical protein